MIHVKCPICTEPMSNIPQVSDCYSVVHSSCLDQIINPDSSAAALDELVDLSEAMSSMSVTLPDPRIPAHLAAPKPRELVVYTADDLAGKKVPELLGIAKKLKLNRYAKMRKRDLSLFIENYCAGTVDSYNKVKYH